MAGTPLTANAINLLNGGDVDLRPVLQVMDVRQIGNAQSTQERFRLVLSDGVFVQQAMLATQLNEYVKSKEVVKGTIVQLVEYICNSVQNRKIIIVLNMEVLQPAAEIIGDPINLATGAERLSGGGPSAAHHQQQQPPQPPQPHAAPHTPQQFRGSPAIPGRAPAQAPSPAYANGNWESKPVLGGGGAPGPPQMAGGGYGGFDTRSHQGYAANGPGNDFQGQRQMGMNPTGGGGAAGGGGFGQTATYGRPLPAYQPPPMYSVKGPIAKNEAPARIVPIAALNPYQGKWTIKARVTAKGELRRFHNARGEGKVFSFDLLDAEGGEIRCTCFNNVADQFYEKIDEGRVYTITKGQLKPSQKQFNHLKNEWEITLENASTVEPCYDEDNTIPQQIYDFKAVSEIETLENNSMVDIVGVVLAIQDAQQIMRKNGTETTKRSLTLTDRSERSVELTMWGAFCNKEGEEIHRELQTGRNPIVAIKAGRVSEFSGKSIGTLNTSHVLINPDLPEAHKLRAWHDREGKNTVVASISKEGTGSRNDARKVVSQIKDENLGRNEKPDWITVRATISFIKADTFCYTACPLRNNDKQCSKKVTNNGDGTWRCDRCDQTVAECDYRYLLQMQVQDHSGLTWISGFQEAGEEIFGVQAKDLMMWKQVDDPKFGETIQKVLFSTHLFKLKVKEETFQDEARVKCTVVKSEKLNYITEGKMLLDAIRNYEQGEPTPQQSTMGYNTPGAAAMSFGGAPAHGATPYTSNYTSNVQAVQSPGGFGVGGGGYGGASAYTGGHGGATNGGISSKCYKCGQDGHFASSCPRTESNFQGGGGAPGGGSCYSCGQGGHFARDCPNQGGGRNVARGGGGFSGSGYGY